MYLASLIVSGLALGALYGLIALGFAIVYKVSKVVNFAHGDVMMLIAYIAFSTANYTGANSVAIIASVIVSSIVIGLSIERFIVRPMIGQPVFSIVMMTIALSILIRSVSGLIWGSFSYNFPGFESSSVVQLFGINMLPAQIALLVIFAVICVAIWAFLRFSIVGIAMRATANDPMVSLLMGVSIRRLYMLAWTSSALVAGIAGVLFSSIYHIGPELSHAGLRAFPATILGGLDSIIGSAFGGVVIGIVENLTGGYIGSGFKEIAGFALILIVMMVRPYGLFGEQRIERV